MEKATDTACRLLTGFCHKTQGIRALGRSGRHKTRLQLYVYIKLHFHYSSKQTPFGDLRTFCYTLLRFAFFSRFMLRTTRSPHRCSIRFNSRYSHSNDEDRRVQSCTRHKIFLVDNRLITETIFRPDGAADDPAIFYNNHNGSGFAETPYSG